MIKFMMDLCEIVIVIVQDVVVVIMGVYVIVFDVEIKFDCSLFIVVDLVVNQVIECGFGQFILDLLILFEELVQVLWEVCQYWGVYWLVDLFDGICEFVKCNDEFSVNIVLIYQGVLVFGVVLVLVSGMVWYVMCGELVYCCDGMCDLVLCICMLVVFLLKVVVSCLYCSLQMQVLLDWMGGIELVVQGLLLKFCWFVEGMFDVYFWLGLIVEWDIVVGQCVLYVVGGVVLLVVIGKLFCYNCCDILLNGDFIVLGDICLLWCDWLFV